MELASASNPPPSLVGERDLNDMLAVAAEAPAGCFVEVGVYKGGSAWHLLRLAERQGRALFLYDTFTGIPFQEPGDAHNVGDFADVDLAAVAEALKGATIARGIFPASAMPMPQVAFAHLDCDQYRSVRESALYLLPRMARGGVIWFDDSPCLVPARRAAEEIFGSSMRMSYEHGKHYVVC